MIPVDRATLLLFPYPFPGPLVHQARPTVGHGVCGGTGAKPRIRRALSELNACVRPSRGSRAFICGDAAASPRATISGIVMELGDTIPIAASMRVAWSMRIVSPELRGLK